MKYRFRNLKKFDLFVLFAFVLLIICSLLSGYFYFENYTSEFNANVVRRLSTIAELKADDLVQWRKERERDVEFFVDNIEFSSLVQKYLSDPKNAVVENKVNLLMTKLYSANDYDAVFLVDEQHNNKIVIYDGRGPFQSALTANEIESTRSGKVVFEDFHYDAHSRKIFSNILIPILDQHKTNRLMGVVVMRVAPEQYLYPFLERWPSGGVSGETYLVRREGRDVVFLNPLRFKKAAAVLFHLPMKGHENDVAVQAVNEPAGVVEGIDYRGAHVVADVRPIPDSPWVMITQMDRSEIYAPYKEREWTVAIAMILLVTSTGAIFGFALKHNSEKYLRMQLDTANELYESRENLAITLNSIGDGVISTDLDGNIVHLNPVAEKLCGYSLAQAKGKPLVEVFNIIEPDSYQNVLNPVARVMESGEIIELSNHTTLISREGAEYQIADSAAPIKDEHGNILGVVLVFSDISEKYKNQEALRESEARYKMLAENSFDVIWTMDLTGNFTYVSPSVAHLRGYTPEEIMQQSFDEMFSPASQKTMLHHMRKHIAAAQEGRQLPTENFEVEQPCKDGTSVWTEIVMRVMYDESGSAVGIIGISRNIQERKRTEQALQHAQRMESIGVLAGGIAHDFNNLLGTMMGNLSLAENYLTDHHQARTNITKTLAAIDRAAELTQQLLAYSGKGKIQTAKIDLGELVEEHVSLFKISLPKNVTLKTHLSAEPVYINGDPGQIEQIIMNLIINGGEALGDKHGIVSINLSSVVMGTDVLLQYSKLTNNGLKEGSYAMLEVSEDGIGMSQETLSRIFDPFFTTKFTGRGLGLSAVLGIIKGHKGGISVVSKEGVGTTFRVILPMCDPPEKGTTSAEVNTAQDGSVTTTVLVIDDESAIASMADEILKLGNYITIVELNPLKGIEQYKQHHAEIGVVLLDLTMPEMSGKEVLDALREINPGVKIIISSGYSQEEMLKKIGLAKVSGFIQKPYRIQSLLTMVHEVLNENTSSG
jgi:two-component system, cell cycle sensor histidine kinase and response regulator CckA